MRLLIISSEPLNPRDTFPSTFELSQAKLLSAAFDVAICSVGERCSWGARTRRRIRSLMGHRLRGTPEPPRHELSMPAQPRVQIHQIEGIAVYEGLADRPEGGEFAPTLRKWVSAGRRAYSTYVRRQGAPDIVHAHGRFLNAGALALAIHKKWGVPYVYTDHSSAYQRKTAPAEARAVLKQVIDQAYLYSTVSPALAQSVARFLGGQVREARVLPNALDPIFETQPMRKPTKAGPFVVIAVASLNPNKGLDLLIRAFAGAFARDRTYRLDICGGGEMRAELEAIAAETGVADQVRFLGHLPKTEVLRHLDAAHVLAVASHVETYGVVLVEAMSRGRPVVATRCGGPDSLVEAQNGRLVPPGDVRAMRDALQAVARSYDSFDLCGIRRTALARYGQAAFVRRMTDIYGAAAA